MRTLSSVAAAVLVGLICLGPGLASPARADAASDRAEMANIDHGVNQALGKLYKTVPGAKEVARHAKGTLVFPAIYKAGFVIGGQYGKGALRIRGKSVAYYNTLGAAFGLLAGGEKRSIVVMFQTKEALQRFRQSDGWDVGADASVTLVEIGANGAIDAATLNKPILVFIFGNTGLMANLSLKGTKISRLDLPAGASAASGSSAPK
jgi:lipid-binding SYLF domain-containing protein